MLGLGWAQEAAGALAMRPDCVLVDVMLPGASGFDPLAELERLTGERFDRDAVLAERDARRQAMFPHHLMPGADELLAGARDAGLETAIVTSNSLVNVEGHLARAGSTHRFDAIVCGYRTMRWFVSAHSL